MMSNFETITAEIMAITEVALPAGYGPQTRLRDAGIDSIDIFDLILALEWEYGAKVSDEEAARWEKLSDVMAWADHQRPAAAICPFCARKMDKAIDLESAWRNYRS